MTDEAEWELCTRSLCLQKVPKMVSPLKAKIFLAQKGMTGIRNVEFAKNKRTMFVEFNTPKDAQEALRQFQDILEWEGQKVIVSKRLYRPSSKAGSKSPPPPSSSSRPRSRGGGSDVASSKHNSENSKKFSGKHSTTAEKPLKTSAGGLLDRFPPFPAGSRVYTNDPRPTQITSLGGGGGGLLGSGGLLGAPPIARAQQQPTGGFQGLLADPWMPKEQPPQQVGGFIRGYSTADLEQRRFDLQQQQNANINDLLNAHATSTYGRMFQQHSNNTAAAEDDRRRALMDFSLSHDHRGGGEMDLSRDRHGGVDLSRDRGVGLLDDHRAIDLLSRDRGVEMSRDRGGGVDMSRDRGGGVEMSRDRGIELLSRDRGGGIDESRDRRIDGSRDRGMGLLDDHRNIDLMSRDRDRDRDLSRDRGYPSRDQLDQPMGGEDSWGPKYTSDPHPPLLRSGDDLQLLYESGGQAQGQSQTGQGGQFQQGGQSLVDDHPRHRSWSRSRSRSPKRNSKRGRRSSRSRSGSMSVDARQRVVISQANQSYGMLIANRLDKMNEKQQAFAKMKIEEALYSAEFGLFGGGTNSGTTADRGGSVEASGAASAIDQSQSAHPQAPTSSDTGGQQHSSSSMVNSSMINSAAARSGQQMLHYLTMQLQQRQLRQRQLEMSQQERQVYQTAQQQLQQSSAALDPLSQQR